MANELKQSDPLPLGVAAGMRPARQRAPHPMQSHSIHVDLLIILLGLLVSTVVVIALLLLPTAWQDMAAPLLLFLRVIVGLPMVLLLPGYALVAALFPDRSIGLAERMVMTVGGSLVSAIAAGVVLNYISDIRRESVLVALSIITLVASLLAYVRRTNQVARGEAAAPRRITGMGLSGGPVALFGVSALLVSAAVVASVINAQIQRDPPFTQFWMVPATPTATTSSSATPTALTLTDGKLRVGIHNFEGETAVYAMNIKVDDEVVLHAPNIALEQGTNWQMPIQLDVPPTARRIEAQLFRIDNASASAQSNPSAYRSVALDLKPQVGP